MKRDLGIVMKIMTAIEAAEAGEETDFPSLGIERKTLVGHVKILKEAGFLWSDESEFLNNRPVRAGLTWAGHEWLDARRSPNVRPMHL